MVYATYIGGSGNEAGNRITVDSSGNAYIFGDTLSSNLPVRNALQPTYSGGYDAFIAKLDPAGAIVYLTYIGGPGADAARSGKVDAAGDLIFCGETSSTNLPTVNPLQAQNAGGLDIYVMGLNPTGSALIYSTYLGGSANDYANSMGLDSQGNIYIAGYSLSTDFPLKFRHKASTPATSMSRWLNSIHREQRSSFLPISAAPDWITPIKLLSIRPATHG